MHREPLVPLLVATMSTILIVAFGATAFATKRFPVSDEHEEIATQLRVALDALESPTGDRSRPLDGYAAQLSRIKVRLQSHLAQLPLDTVSVQRLAAVDWELSALQGNDVGTAAESLIDLASSRSPKDPHLAIELGNLLYRMGRLERGDVALRHAVELSHSSARSAVELMLRNGRSVLQIADSLPDTWEVLLSLEDEFLARHLEAEFMSRLEPFLDADPLELLPVYADVALSVDGASTLLERTSKPFRSESDAVATLRAAERARALLASGAPEHALVEARDVRSATAADPVAAELIGDVESVCGDPMLAMTDFRRALAARALRGDPSQYFARLYRKLGRAAENAGQSDQAVDAYQHSVASGAGDEYARIRLSALGANLHDDSPAPHSQAHPAALN